MRMKHMYYLIKENYFTIKRAVAIESGTPTNRSYKISNWQYVLRAYDELSVLPCLNDLIEDILNLQIGMRREGRNEEIFSQDTNLEYKALHAKIVSKMEAIIEFCEDAGFDESQHGFDVKMPPTNDFSEFTEYIRDLNIVLSQCPFLKVEDERLEIRSTESGSIWLVFAIVATGTAATILLLNLAKIVDVCIKIKSHITTVKQQEEMLRSMKLKNDELKSNLATLDKLKEAYFKRALEDLKIDNEKDMNPEDDSKTIMTIKILTELFDKGLEIVASLDSPKEVKDLFPTSDEIVRLPFPQKMLSEGNE